MNKDTIAIFLILLVTVVVWSIWWLPQKWEACTKLYDNTPAQIICLLDD